MPPPRISLLDLSDKNCGDKTIIAEPQHSGLLTSWKHSQIITDIITHSMFTNNAGNPSFSKF